MNVVGADTRVSADRVSEVASSAMLALDLEPLDRRMEATGLTYASDALRALGIHTWPGNVRELPEPRVPRGDHGRRQARHGPRSGTHRSLQRLCCRRSLGTHNGRPNGPRPFILSDRITTTTGRNSIPVNQR
jgi:hypothetical protein